MHTLNIHISAIRKFEQLYKLTLSGLLHFITQN